MSTYQLSSRYARRKAVKKKFTKIFQTGVTVYILVLLSIIYSGAFQFLAIISKSLLYGFYVALFGGIALAIFSKKDSLHALRVFFPYLIWLCFFLIWGTFFSNDPNQILLPVIRLLLTNTLILAAMGSAIAHESDLVKFGYMLAIVAIINLAISIQGVIDPGFVSKIAFAINPTAIAFDELRPAGLWSNPNEAAFGFLFIFLVSFWCKGTVAWAGRVAAVAGIYLTASRSGVYILLVCLAIVGFFHLRSKLVYFITLTSVLILFYIGQSFIFADRFNPLNLDLFQQNQTVNRLLDYSEDNLSNTRITRQQLTQIAARYAYEAPWHGYGIFVLHGLVREQPNRSLDVGAHNIYLLVYGEAGIISGFGLLVILIIGNAQVLRLKLPVLRKLPIILMWVSYMLIGFVWHNQFSSTLGVLFIGFLYLTPHIMSFEVLDDVKKERFPKNLRVYSASRSTPILGINPPIPQDKTS